MRRLLLCIALLLVVVPDAHAARGLTTGFFDSVLGEQDGIWRERAHDLGARIVRLNVAWRDVAPVTRPEGFDAADPGAAGYRWEAVDAAVARLRAGGFTVLLGFDRAPDWAEGPGRASSAAPGTWKPDPAAVGAFARAMARRYAGQVRHYMLWNEPNLSVYLTPQWTPGRRPASPAHYRKMLRSFSAAVKGVSASNLVLAGATSPYGDDDPEAGRLRPARFVRELLCCGTLRFDILTHHPYSVGRPRRKALSKDDVSIPDLGKLTRLLRRATAAGRLAKRPKLWVTEVSYDSRPPDPHGVPSATHARWVAETLYLLWKQGASAVVWLGVVDSAPNPSYAASYQSGMYLLDGRAKRSARAFRFPFVVDGTRAWGKAPAAGRLVIERRAGSRWVRVAALTTRAGAVFTRRVRRVRRATYRARVGSFTSSSWRS